MRVAVFEEFSGGAGNQWRASVWMASFLASSTLGHVLSDYEVGVSSGGFVDGPSAGGITTAALMASMLGVPVDRAATMTGTVNPDGSIGPVGGIPQKLAGAAAKGKKRFGYPVGQRFDTDLATGQLVDLKEFGASRKLEAREVKDVYDAYLLLTGRSLPRPTPLAPEALELTPAAEARFKKVTLSWLGRTQSNLAALQKKPAAPRLTAPLISNASASSSRAASALAQGLFATAYARALEAAAYSDLAKVMSGFATLAAENDLKKLVREVTVQMSLEAELNQTFQELGSLRPKTANGSLGLLSAYSAAVTSAVFLQLANAELADFRAVEADLRKGEAPIAWAPVLQDLKGPEQTQMIMDLLASKLMAPMLYALMARYSMVKETTLRWRPTREPR
ncbi:MAG: S16 family serine protease [Myxococcaceae bacterium]